LSKGEINFVPPSWQEVPSQLTVKCPRKLGVYSTQTMGDRVVFYLMIAFQRDGSQVFKKDFLSCEAETLERFIS
jgi:hypothetical protein